ncbi:MAG: hypothetical protein QXF88_01665 [Candidatus Aenigmatarchaeota archaeon]
MTFLNLMKSLYDIDITEKFRKAKENVSRKVNDFAREYLSSEAYRYYSESIKNLKYEISYLPSRIINVYNYFKGKTERFVEGVLGLYDIYRNKITINKYLDKPEDIEAVMAHERVHHATRNWIVEYFRRFGEAARPVIEGFTDLATSLMGYKTHYNQYVYRAYQTLRKMGYNIRDGLKKVLNFQTDPNYVMSLFYGLNRCYR